MQNITLCYSTHRPETLALTARIMNDHDVIVLEEPLHPDFHKALGGAVKLEDHLLELDIDYPDFALGQYQQLQQFYKAGKEILQIEPYFDHLLSIEKCRNLFQQIRSLTSVEAADFTERYLKRRE